MVTSKSCVFRHSRPFSAVLCVHARVRVRVRVRVRGRVLVRAVAMAGAMARVNGEEKFGVEGEDESVDGFVWTWV